MSGVDKLLLEDALEDSPQTRHLLRVFEKDALLLKKYSTGLHSCCQRVLSAQNELCRATQALSQHLREYELQTFPLESENSVLTSTLKQFSSYLDDNFVGGEIYRVYPLYFNEYQKLSHKCGLISSVQQVLSSQFTETMMYPLSKFLQADIEEISTMYEMFQISTHEHEQTVSKHQKLPKKKDNEKMRLEVNEELYHMRKKFHQTALHYYSSLNALQYKRKCFLLEPIVGYIHAMRAFFQMGHDSVCKPEIDEFVCNISASVQSVHQELNGETQKTVELIDSLEHQSAHKYHGEPPPDMPFIPPNTSLSQKAGYLFLRSKQVLTSKWERLYFFTQAGNLMSQSKEVDVDNPDVGVFCFLSLLFQQPQVPKHLNFEVPGFAGSLVLDLNEEGITVQPAESDDRRFVFQITAPSTKKTVILQAENERERDEWLATINNIIKESGYMKGNDSSNASKDTSSSELETPISSAVKSSSPSQSSENLSTNEHDFKVPPKSMDGLILDTPIQFDLITPTEECKQFSPQTGPPKRINPFDQPTYKVYDPATDNAAYSESFVVRFLGSMEVKADRGEQIVFETIRQIMAARAIHNVFKMTESKLLITNHAMRLLDPSTNAVRTEFTLADISYWSAHHENNRLFGFITRTKTGVTPSFACHVFECNTSSEEICQSISTATKIAFQALMEKKQTEKKNSTQEEDNVKEKKKSEKSVSFQEEEKTNDKLLLENIDQLDDICDTLDSNLPLSPDGRFLILTARDPEMEEEEEEKKELPEIRDTGDGDEREVEGTDVESEA